jgi:CRP-like cAMP-binding protein
MSSRRQDHKVATLARLRLFRACSRDDLLAVSRFGEVWDAAPGTRLQSEAEPVRAWCVLQEGSAAASRMGRPTALFGPGDSWGEGTVLAAPPAPVTVQALTAVRVLTFDRRAMRSLIGTAPSVGLAVVERLAGWQPSYAVVGARTARADQATA